MALEVCLPEIVSRYISLYRRPRHDGDTTLAAHWDGTYRDRVFGSPSYGYWEDSPSNPDDYSEMILPSDCVAKHLASETFNSDNAESVAGWII